jgi:hypothetical protein
MVAGRRLSGIDHSIPLVELVVVRPDVLFEMPGDFLV